MLGIGTRARTHGRCPSSARFVDGGACGGGVGSGGSNVVSDFSQVGCSVFRTRVLSRGVRLQASPRQYLTNLGKMIQKQVECVWTTDVTNIEATITASKISDFSTIKRCTHSGTRGWLYVATKGVSVATFCGTQTKSNLNALRRCIRCCYAAN